MTVRTERLVLPNEILQRRERRKIRAANAARSFVVNVFRYALIICLSYLILAPIFINISTAFTYPRDVGLSSSIWIPSRVSTENWHVSMLVLNYKTALPYTLVQTAIIAILQTLCAMLAAYSFARLRFPGRGLLFACVVFTIIVPPQVFMLPQYVYFRNFDFFGIIKAITGKPLNLLGNPLSLVLVNITGVGLKGGLFIYILRQTYRGLPKALEEAAYVDGAGFMRTFWGIVVPSSTSGLLTVMVLSFVWNWNDAYYIRLFDSANTNNLMLAYTRAVGSVDEAIARIASQVPAHYAFLQKNPMYEAAIGKTAALLVFLPLVFLYMIIQRRFVQGVERSGIMKLIPGNYKRVGPGQSTLCPGVKLWKNDALSTYH